MANNDLVKTWLDVGRNDMAAVEQLTTHHPLMLEIVCFHCQQAAEKFLKAYLLARTDEQPPRMHELSSLCGQCAEFEPAFLSIERECVRLNPYGVVVRYPHEIPLEEADMRQAVQDMYTVTQFIQRQLSQE